MCHGPELEQNLSSLPEPLYFVEGKALCKRRRHHPEHSKLLCALHFIWVAKCLTLKTNRLGILEIYPDVAVQAFSVKTYMHVCVRVHAHTHTCTHTHTKCILLEHKALHLFWNVRRLSFKTATETLIT